RLTFWMVVEVGATRADRPVVGFVISMLPEASQRILMSPTCRDAPTPHPDGNSPPSWARTETDRPGPSVAASATMAHILLISKALALRFGVSNCMKIPTDAFRGQPGSVQDVLSAEGALDSRAPRWCRRSGNRWQAVPNRRARRRRESPP